MKFRHVGQKCIGSNTIWKVRDGRLSECWVERGAWELYQALTAKP